MFQLSDPLSGSTLPSVLPGRMTRPQALVNVILAQSGMKCDLVDIKVEGGLFHLAASTDKRDYTLAKLWRVRTGHKPQPFMKAID